MNCTTCGRPLDTQLDPTSTNWCADKCLLCWARDGDLEAESRCLAIYNEMESRQTHHHLVCMNLRARGVKP